MILLGPVVEKRIIVKPGLKVNQDFRSLDKSLQIQLESNRSQKVE